MSEILFVKGSKSGKSSHFSTNGITIIAVYADDFLVTSDTTERIGKLEQVVSEMPKMSSI